MKKLLLIILIATTASAWEYMGEITNMTELTFSDAFFPINNGRRYISFVIDYETDSGTNTIRIRETYLDGYPNIGYHLYKEKHKDGYIIYKVKVEDEK